MQRWERGVRGGVGSAVAGKAYLDRGSGNSLGGALDLEGFDGSGDLCERHVECVVSEKKGTMRENCEFGSKTQSKNRVKR